MLLMIQILYFLLGQKCGAYQSILINKHFFFPFISNICIFDGERDFYYLYQLCEQIHGYCCASVEEHRCTSQEAWEDREEDNDTTIKQKKSDVSWERKIKFRETLLCRKVQFTQSCRTSD